MNAEITLMQGKIFDLFEDQAKHLADKPAHVIDDLLHESKDLRNSQTFSIRVAAEINFTACTLITEQRAKS